MFAFTLSEGRCAHWSLPQVVNLQTGWRNLQNTSEITNNSNHLLQFWIELCSVQIQGLSKSTQELPPRQTINHWLFWTRFCEVHRNLWMLQFGITDWKSCGGAAGGSSLYKMVSKLSFLTFYCWGWQLSWSNGHNYCEVLITSCALVKRYSKVGIFIFLQNYWIIYNFNFLAHPYHTRLQFFAWRLWWSSWMSPIAIWCWRISWRCWMSPKQDVVKALIIKDLIDKNEVLFQ